MHPTLAPPPLFFIDNFSGGYSQKSIDLCKTWNYLTPWQVHLPSIDLRDRKGLWAPCFSKQINGILNWRFLYFQQHFKKATFLYVSSNINYYEFFFNVAAIDACQPRFFFFSSNKICQMYAISFVFLFSLMMYNLHIVSLCHTYSYFLELNKIKWEWTTVLIQWFNENLKSPKFQYLPVIWDEVY